MENANCLNCGLELSGKFCSGCGQKSDTQRISFKRFISHDILHGTFHFEKGMLFTAKQALIRPGRAALDYIGGKRVRFYNIFYFILLLIGLLLILTHYNNELALQYKPERSLIPQMDDAGKKIYEFLTTYNKLLIFTFAPVMALNSFLIFRRKKFNYSEHFILSGILLLGLFILILLFFMLSFLEFAGLPSVFREWGFVIMSFLIFFYVLYAYYDAFRKDYSLIGFVMRMLLLLFLCTAELFIFFLLIIMIASNGATETEIEFSY
ncbi:MAG: DUF3667 domain-containing protein [Saprospiraceae bacterium]|nr:DUF3667 domain-containing protein [Saprospiraceae bacterium]